MKPTITDPRELPHLTDDALVEIVEDEVARSGRRAINELVKRHGVKETAELLDCPTEALQ